MHRSNKCYTDNNGDVAANQVLSADRATVVKNALLGMVIDAGRIDVHVLAKYNIATNKKIFSGSKVLCRQLGCMAVLLYTLNLIKIVRG